MATIIISTNETLPLRKQQVIHKEESYPFVASLIIIVAMVQTTQVMAIRVMVTLLQATVIPDMEILVMVILVKITLPIFTEFSQPKQAAFFAF